MSDPATCIPPDASVSGWWYLSNLFNGVQPSSPAYETQVFWEERTRAWLWGKTSYYYGNDMWRMGYRILDPVPSHAEAEQWKAAALNSITENATWAQRCFDLADELKSANARADTLREALVEWQRRAVELERTPANAESERLKRYIAGAHRCLEVDDNKTGALQTLKSALENEDV